jgi:hypothetical protein
MRQSAGGFSPPTMGAINWSRLSMIGSSAVLVSRVLIEDALFGRLP